MKKAFTLVEILIVVSILGILAAVVVPEFGNHIQQAKEAAAKDTLRVLRGTIERYYIDNDVAPGYAEKDSSGAASSVYFYMQVISQSKLLMDLPENPFNDKFDMNVIQNSSNMPAKATGASGWIYKPSSRTIRLDWAGTDSEGKAYYSY